MMPMPLGAGDAGGGAREEAVEAGPPGSRASAAARFPKQPAAADAGSFRSSPPTAARRAKRKAAAPSLASAKSTRFPGPSTKSLTVRTRASAAAVRVLEGAMQALPSDVEQKATALRLRRPRMEPRMAYRRNHKA